MEKLEWSSSSKAITLLINTTQSRSNYSLHWSNTREEGETREGGSYRVPNIVGLFDKLFSTLPLFLFTSPTKIKSKTF
jgi:hypothetical protein